MSQIHSIMLVKNEADIVAHCLNEAAKWSDFIYVYDNGSDDGTWEIVQSMANERIIPFKQDGRAFKEGLRSEVFNAYRKRAAERDWWCRLDADEFYVDNPATFLPVIGRSQQVVWAASIQYYLTQEDVEKLDFSLAAEQLLKGIRWYSATTAEPRFFRHRRRLAWNEDSAWPTHMGISSKELIRVRHYKYRSPAQIQRRLDVRRDARRRGFEGWEHAKQLDWREKIASSDGLAQDTRDGQYIIDYARLPDHRGSALRRGLQRTFHSLGIWP